MLILKIMNKLIKSVLMAMVAVAVCSSCTTSKANLEETHFAMTCKIDCVNGEFSTPEGRERAIEWFKRHHISRVYLESYRHGFEAPSHLLEEAKKAFEAAGLDVAGCITTTKMSQTAPPEWPITTCYSDPTGIKFLTETVERTAKIFDLIILDDFFLSACTCELCQEAKGDRDWTTFRLAHMMEVGEKYILEPARRVNPNCKIIVKYPCWYEDLQVRGYDAINQTALFDYAYVGTETREGGPQTQAAWYQMWINDIGQEKSLGGWFDPLGTKPETFVEQARQTILGGAKEVLLHSYDYLATRNVGIAIHDGDEGVKYGIQDAAAFEYEVKGLQQMIDYIKGYEAYGIMVPKKPNERPQADVKLVGQVGLLGIPFLGTASLKEGEGYFLTDHSSRFDNLHASVQKALTNEKPVVCTQAVYQALKGTGEGTWQEAPEAWGVVLKGKECTPIGNPFEMSREELNQLRNGFTAQWGIELDAPCYVSMHLFKKGNDKIEVIENFNDEAINVKLNYKEAKTRKVGLALPDAGSAAVVRADENLLELTIQPRSLVLIASE